MTTQPTTEDPRANAAREFLVRRVTEQAQLEGTPLSDIEKRMLTFSETMDADADFQAAEEFDDQFDDQQFEARVAKLVKHAYTLDRKEAKEVLWKEALRSLKGQDFYLLVMVEQAGLHVPESIGVWLPNKKVVLLIGTFILVFGTGVYFLAFRLQTDWAKMIFLPCWVLVLWGITRIRIN